MSLVAREIRMRADHIGRVIRRASVGPLLVRVAAFVLTCLGLALALPPGALLSRYAPGLLVLALLPAVAPRTWLVTAVILLTAVGWVVTSLLYSDIDTVLRLVALAVVLYLVHTTAALAAVLPYDAVIRLVTVLPWAGRALAVAAGTAGLGVFALSGSGALSQNSYLLASILGVAVVAGLVWFLARLR